MNAIRKVLVVDDDPAVSNSFDQALAQKNYQVVTAGNGQDALSKLAHGDYVAVFIDIVLPGMDGIEVAQRMRATHPDIPVVIMTGYGSAEHRARAAAAGSHGFLCKPLSSQMIETSLNAAVAAASRPGTEMLVQGSGASALVASASISPASHHGTERVAGQRRTAAQVVKDIALFFASPFITMGSLALFPFIGAAMLAEAWRHRKSAG